MSHLEKLKEERTNRNAIWLSFTTAYRPGVKLIYVFFEGGEDFNYYMPELRRVWNEQDIVPFECRGKHSVLWLLPKVLTKLDSLWRGAFFIDKDLDDLLAIEKTRHDYLFETECYSLENYLVSDEMFRMIWTDTFGLPILDPRLPASLSQFHQCMKLCVQAILPVMATILALRKAKDNCHLKNFKLDKVMKIDETFQPVLIANWYEQFKKDCCNTTDPQKADLDAHIALFGTLNPKRFVRGKYELWFFMEFLRRLEPTLNQPGSGLEKPRVKVRPWDGSPVEILAGKTAPPASLVQFLTRWKAAAGTV